MYHFPTDPQRRAVWVEKIRRSDWQPTKSSCICSAHFDESSFEQRRADGWKKLKPNAVPTIFTFKPPPRHRNTPKQMAGPIATGDVAAATDLVQPEGACIATNDMETATGSVRPESEGIATGDAETATDSVLPEGECSAAGDTATGTGSVLPEGECSATGDTATGTDSVLSGGERIATGDMADSVPLAGSFDLHEEQRCDWPDSSLDGLEADSADPQWPATTLNSKASDLQATSMSYADMTRKYGKLQELHKRARSTITCLRNKLKRLEGKIETFGKNLKFLNEDQIQMLSCQGNKRHTWSPQTIKQALQIKSSCGISGYETLRKLGYPLPDTRTLNRHLQRHKCRPGVLTEVVSQLEVNAEGMRDIENECVLDLSDGVLGSNKNR